ncbi:MAG: hypothetical protein E3J50_00790 [Dehalococcoidia bacterium]|nr:MAG: hypothetical protein E3J50_00790 [Dehalococcoidia bacterium]
MCHHSECGCEQHPHHAPEPGWHHQRGCCCGSGHAPGQSPTREEMVEKLEEYLKHLGAEAKGVEERIAELKKKG